MAEVSNIHQLGPEQCGNQTAYGLPWSLYCTNYKAVNEEYCPACSRDTRENYPGTDTSRRNWPVEMLTLFAPSGYVFVWPQRGQEGEEQRGQIFVFDHISFWAKQMAHGPRSLKDDGHEQREHWGDIVNIYEHREFHTLLSGRDGIPYSMETLREFASVYGKPTPGHD